MLVVELLFLLSFPLIGGVMAAIVVYRAAGWCLNRGWRTLRFLFWLVLAALAAGTVYGLLRLTGIVLLPDDNTWSVNWLEASWRDDGFRILLHCGAPLAGIAAALRQSGTHG